ncbi:CHAD domain-containing protein, partial [Paracoccus sp. (in: a-proteobacteria)]|uniref:CHAD domain-containing protein n=1 Tax=Paracoccus sp. TaxID=267 RepID=UPI0026DF9F09
MSGLQAFRRLIEQGAATHDAQIEPILTSDDPEAVHRARVALRRMRSTVRGFADMLSPDAGGRLEAVLAERFRRLGPLRDADVHAGELAGTPAGDEAARQAADLRKALRAELRDDAWVPLSDEVARLLDGSRLVRGGRRRRLAEASVQVIASRALQVAWTEMLAFGNDLGRLSEDDLHDFRKRAKDMRYLSEFFGPLWPGRPEAEMVRRMAKMQDALGTLNDLTNMRRNAQEGP